jgi:hypothetical protein
MFTMNRAPVWLPTVCALAVGASALPVAAHAQSAPAACKRSFTANDKTVVEISGRVRNQIEYGPPFRDDRPPSKNRQYTVWIVRLDSPLRVISDFGNKKAEIFVVRDIQIRRFPVGGPGPDRPRQYPDLRGKHVHVVGTLWAQVEWFDVPTIVIDPVSVKADSKVVC